MLTKTIQLTLVYLLFMANTFLPNENCREKQNKEIQVSFKIDDSLQNVANKFDILFINKNDTLKGKTNKNIVMLPDIHKELTYDVMFRFKDNNLVFKGIKGEIIIPDQNIEWKFGIDNRPFNNLLGLLSYKEYQNDRTTKKLIYFQFNLLEHGDGIQFVQKIQ